MTQSEETATQKPTTTTVFHFSEAMFPDSYIEYVDRRNKKVKSDPAKTGKTIFKWHKIQFHHISVAGNGVDYLIHDGIIICSFPIGKDRNDIYDFLDKYWDERIEPFCRYIDKRRELEVSTPHDEAHTESHPEGEVPFADV